MKRKQLDFQIQEAGCLIYVADRNLAGFPFGQFHEFFGGRPGLRDLTLRGAVMAGSLYQDDGYNVRVVFGDIDERESAEWTSRAAWKLNLESGTMVISGVCDEDLESYLDDFPHAEDGSEYELGTLMSVDPGEYAVTIYSYPPGDLAGGWMRIEDKGLYRICFGRDSGIPHEKPIDYFNRTRPGETPREWHKAGWEDVDFLSFLIQIKPVEGEVPVPDFEEDGCIKWEYRKPVVCPMGIELKSAD